jgi:ketosteroid isomerase-like protein
MSALEIGKRYVALCKEGKYDECLDELFAESAVSVEAGGPPGMDRTAKGLTAIRAKGEWWRDNHTVHRVEVSGPYPNENRFAVRFFFDVTNKPSGQRMSMDEVALFTVEGGKITREEFFYTMG